MFKRIFIKALAVLNFAEGFIHIVGAGLSFYGMWDVGIWDWRIAAAPSADLFLGVMSIITGIVLNRWGCHHHQEKDENIQTVCRD
jgi:branched-subunit amino acid ABC-type transport system permease component